jgi:hypothetical protein
VWAILTTSVGKILFTDQADKAEYFMFMKMELF